MCVCVCVLESLSLSVDVRGPSGGLKGLSHYPRVSHVLLLGPCMYVCMHFELSTRL